MPVDALEELSNDSFPDVVDDPEIDDVRYDEATVEKSDPGTVRLAVSEYFRTDVTDPRGEVGDDPRPVGVVNEPRRAERPGEEPRGNGNGLVVELSAYFCGHLSCPRLNFMVY